MDIYIGIDPGEKGGISAFYDDDMEDAEKYVMPLKDNKDIDGGKIADIISKFAMMPEELHIYVEDVHAIYRSAAGATFTFGKSVGVIHGVLDALGLDYTLVQPKVWQKQIWIPEDKVLKLSKNGKKMANDTKATSLNAAKRLFPNAILYEEKPKQYYADTYQNRKLGRAGMEKPQKNDPHDGLYDSMLIAHYGRLQYNK